MHQITNKSLVTINYYDKITVTFSDGVSYDAKLIGSDPFSDIAVLQVQNISSATKLEPLPLANSLELKLPFLFIGCIFARYLVYVFIPLKGLSLQSRHCTFLHMTFY